MRNMICVGIWIALVSPAGLAADFSDKPEDNWSQWRGPGMNGVAPNATPPLNWDEKTNIKWKVEIPGQGSSSPVVHGGRVFITTAIKTDRLTDAEPEPRVAPKLPEFPGSEDANPLTIQPTPKNYYQFMVICIDRETGDTLWEEVASEHVPHRAHHNHHGYASSSPVTDGRYVVASFGSEGIYCYNVEGRFQWARDLGDMEVINDFGEAVTPALHGDKLVVQWDHLGDSFIAALNMKNGAILWKKDRDEIAAWTTPLITEYGGRTQVIANGFKRTRSYDLDTGDLIWECGGQGGAIIPVPVRAGDLVICMTGYQGDVAAAIRLDSTGDVTGTKQVVWSRDKATPYVPSPLLYDDLLYYTAKTKAILSCVRASTGDSVYESVRLPGLERGLYASPAGAAGRIYFTGRDGVTLVVKHGPKFETLATNPLDDPIDASPAIAGDQIFLRGARHLYCIAEK